jgi:hypothetical protein
MILNKCIFFSLFFLIIGCTASKGQHEYELPRTLKEIDYVKTLRKRGFQEVTIHNSIMDDSYSISLKSKIPIDEKNVDSFISIRKSIAMELYSKVLEDDYLFLIRSIGVEFIYNPNNVKYDPFYHPYWNKYVQIDSLQKWCGFKVVKVGKDKYKRVQIK